MWFYFSTREDQSRCAEERGSNSLSLMFSTWFCVNETEIVVLKFFFSNKMLGVHRMERLVSKSDQ